MPFTQPWFDVDFGSAHGGLGTVGYRLYKNDGTDSVARTTTGVVDLSGNGSYGVASVVVPDDAAGIEWDTGGGTPVYAVEDIEPYRKRSAILADTAAMQPLVDAAISSRAAPGDAMDLVVDAVDASAVATSGAQEIRDEILDDATRFSGGDIDAAITTRATPAQVKAQADQALIDYDAATGTDVSTAETNIRGADGDDLKDISDQIDTVPADVDTVLSAAHGSGAWDGTLDPGLVWDELMASHVAAGSFGEGVGLIKAKTDLLDFIGGDVKATLDGEAVDISATSLLDIIKGTAEGNVSRDFVVATSQDLVRNVAIGVLDHIILKVKADADPDWSSPIKTWTLWCWYAALGNTNQSALKEDG